MAKDIFKCDDYETKRPLILSGYIEQQVQRQMLAIDGVSEEAIRKAVIEVVQEDLVDPDIEILRHPEPGSTIRETIKLSQHIKVNIAQNIITPSGSAYCLPTVKVSFLKSSLAAKLKERKVYKGIMLKAAEEGDTVKEGTYNLLQASTKIFINAAPGAMGSPHNILYDLPGYNAITSTARHSVKYGYAHVERFLEGNIFFETYTDIAAYCMRLMTVEPKNVLQVVEQYSLYIPSVDDVFEFFMRSHRYYEINPKTDLIRKTVEMLPISTRIFVFYAGCFGNLVMFNQDLFRHYINRFFDTENLAINPSDDPTSVFKFEGDLMTMITATCADDLGRDPDGNRYNLETAQKGNPDGVRKLCAIGRHMNSLLDKMAPVFQCFLRLDTEMPRLGTYENMVRKCVLVSDTDSVIFTTQNMIEWYTKEIKITPDFYKINAFAVYLISRTVEHGLHRLCCGFGVIGDDCKLICMKNEYLYPIMLRTTIKKHYAGLIQIREGKILPKPKEDIKGLQFRGSTLSAETNKAVKDFLIGTLIEIMEKGKLNASSVIGKVVDMEQHIFDSLMSGQRDYLPTVSVSTKETYADDPYKTSYFYYEMWNEVFAHKFDPISLPDKCFKIPLLGGGKVLKAPGFLERLKAFDKKCHDNLIAFMEKWPKKTPSMIIFPMTMAEIPEVLRPIIDVRGIIFTNCSGMYLGLRSMGIAFNVNKESFLASDFYSNCKSQIPLPSEIA